MKYYLKLVLCIICFILFISSIQTIERFDSFEDYLNIGYGTVPYGYKNSINMKN